MTKSTALVRLSFALLILFACSASGSQAPYQFERISLEQGLSQSHVTAMAHGPNGYLWVGTQYGLNRFDGYVFKSWSAGDGSNSLSNGYVRDLMFDRTGQLWIGTQRGLNRLDPETRQIRRYLPAFGEESPQDFIIEAESLVEDDQGDVLTSSYHGPVRWSRTKDQLRFVGVENAPDSFRGSRLLRDADGVLWLAMKDRLWTYSAAQETFQKRFFLSTISQAIRSESAKDRIAAHPETGVIWATEQGLFHVLSDSEHAPLPIQPRTPPRPDSHEAVGAVDSVDIDRQGDWWIHSSNRIIRIDGSDPQRWQPVLDTSERRVSVTGAQRLSVAVTRDGHRWLGGNFGVAVLEPGASRARLLKHDPANARTLPPTLGAEGYTLMTDRFDVLWVGTTLGGLAWRPPQADRFQHVLDLRPETRSINVVRAIAEQHIEGEEWIWVANQSAGVSVWRRSNDGSYVMAKEYRAGLGQLPDNNVRAIAPSPDHETIWISGDGWLASAARPGDPLQITLIEETYPSALGFDAAGHLWIAGEVYLENYISEFRIHADGKPERIRQMTSDSFPMLEGMGFISLCAADTNRMVFAGWGGIVILDTHGKTIRRLLPGGEQIWAPRNQVLSMGCMDRNRFWFGTQNGGLGELRLDERDQATFSFLTRRDGLADDTVYAVLPDPSGKLWISSNRGLQRVNLDSGRVDQFGIRDGLQEYEYNRNVAHIGASGRFFFGGVNGWNVFRPETIEHLSEVPDIHLSSVHVNEQPVDLDDPNRQLELPYDRNRLEFEFVGLQFAGPAHLEYAYRLVGLDPDWVGPGPERRARYASLPPGDYSFEVKAANPDGLWSPARELAVFSIRRPPWNTPLAWVMYAAVAILALLLSLRNQRQRRRHLLAVVQQRTAELAERNKMIEQQASKLEDALAARTTLFANVSHEFRTPLTLINAAIERLRDGPDAQSIALAKRYSSRLLRLVEQLLDLSKFRQRSIAPSEEAWPIDELVRQTVHAFDSLAEQRTIKLEHDIEANLLTRCAQEPAEKIVLNLLANAIKYTPAGGSVVVSMHAIDQTIRIRVEDTGPGIPESEQALIFERFYRAPSTESVDTGTGIGLTLVREAVNALGGQIRLSSDPIQGTRFEVDLPGERGQPEAKQSLVPRVIHVIDDEPVTDSTVISTSSSPTKNGDSEESVLVVEDNEDLRAWLVRELGEEWQMLEAGNGEDALASARTHSPTLIVSDLMMPVMDGFGLLEALRGDVETSHIPVLMLTARQDDEARLKAFTLQADAFLAKPFGMDELRLRLRQMVSARRQLRRRIEQELVDGYSGSQSKDSETSPTDGLLASSGTISKRDAEFLEQVRAWLDAEFQDANADVNELAEACHVSARTLQRKLRSLIGRTPSELLRDWRLSQAREMLRQSQESITAIGLTCGFSSAQYFSRVFRDAHDASPEQWRRDNA